MKGHAHRRDDGDLTGGGEVLAPHVLLADNLPHLTTPDREVDTGARLEPLGAPSRREAHP
ncbi:hypothetical protein GCM10010287_06690 [Streptomyces variabilis]|uniref:Uncharacterized protein n=1 Tax=Streptomyces variabilis TaxID=67372 RepID=A0ABQ2TVP6_9ACTN|nr:hypothetical protein GCM10010265_13560 [Streptomyces griseoincarnatus]GGT36985.1 hypothetical protein GCM10010287_06690 [Streptomyces variabilis]